MVGWAWFYIGNRLQETQPNQILHKLPIIEVAGLSNAAINLFVTAPGVRFWRQATRPKSRINSAVSRRRVRRAYRVDGLSDIARGSTVDCSWTTLGCRCIDRACGFRGRLLFLAPFLFALNCRKAGNILMFVSTIFLLVSCFAYAAPCVVPCVCSEYLPLPPVIPRE